MTTHGVDLADLARVAADDGPFLSVYVASADQWEMVRRELTTAEAPPNAIALIDKTIAAEVLDDEAGDTLAVIATADQVLVKQRVPDQLIYGRGSWAPAADLVPIIKARQERHPSVATPDDPVAVKTAVAEDTVKLLEQFKRDRDRRDLVADGIAQTADAVANGAVEVLLVRDDRDERHNVDPADAAVVDHLIRDAITTGAMVRVVPANGPITEGVGALLRN